jgi:hypothetical protein
LKISSACMALPINLGLFVIPIRCISGECLEWKLKLILSSGQSFFSTVRPYSTRHFYSNTRNPLIQAIWCLCLYRIISFLDTWYSKLKT